MNEGLFWTGTLRFIHILCIYIYIHSHYLFATEIIAQVFLFDGKIPHVKDKGQVAKAADGRFVEVSLHEVPTKNNITLQTS